MRLSKIALLVFSLFGGFALLVLPGCCKKSSTTTQAPKKVKAKKSKSHKKSSKSNRKNKKNCDKKKCAKGPKKRHKKSAEASVVESQAPVEGATESTESSTNWGF